MIKIVCKLFGGRNFRPLCHKMENAEQFAQFAEIFLLRKSVLCWPSIKLLYLCVSLIVVNNKHYFQFVCFSQIAIDEQVNISKVRQLLWFFDKQLCEGQRQRLNALDFFLSRISKKFLRRSTKSNVTSSEFAPASRNRLFTKYKYFHPKSKIGVFYRYITKSGATRFAQSRFCRIKPRW